jgi:lipoprotein-anchoring transpeptidase ErfK/SrfK
MNPDLEAYRQFLLNASQAMQHGDRQAARSWAEKAAAAAPDKEDPWLFLAALSSPRASIAYLERALKINPQSERARKGMHWAASRLRKEKAADSFNVQTRPNQVVPEPTQPHLVTTPEQTQPHIVAAEQTQPNRLTMVYTEPGTKPRPIAATAAQTTAISEPIHPKALAKYRWSFLVILLLAICATAIWAFWPGNASPVMAFLHLPAALVNGHGAPAQVAKPTYTLSPTPTSSPTATFTPSPTFTSTPIPTDTPVPTDTPLPTNTPQPVDTAAPLPTDVPVDPPVNGDERWIDVDLSNQMLYAYEGNTVVASFLVSTGVWQFPTVTGQFHIYVKLVSTLMAGDGYYLPDVPYTMYFYKGYGLHGTYWHNNFGHPMSHGCVNMYTPDAKWLFYWASVGTLVNIHY